MSDRVWHYIRLTCAATITACGFWEIDHGSWVAGGLTFAVGLFQAWVTIHIYAKG